MGHSLVALRLPHRFLFPTRSSFSEFAQRHGRDERFKAVEKMREREQLFTEYLQELKKTASAGSARGRHKSIEIHSSSGHAKADKVCVSVWCKK